MREAAEKEQRSGSAAAAKREPKRKAVTFAVENVSPASGHIHCQYWPIVVEKKEYGRVSAKVRCGARDSELVGCPAFLSTGGLGVGVCGRHGRLGRDAAALARRGREMQQFAYYDAKVGDVFFNMIKELGMGSDTTHYLRTCTGRRLLDTRQTLYQANGERAIEEVRERDGLYYEVCAASVNLEYAAPDRDGFCRVGLSRRYSRRLKGNKMAEMLDKCGHVRGTDDEDNHTLCERVFDGSRFGAFRVHA
eukprot:6421173-Prymnesium_polylepis.1